MADKPSFVRRWTNYRVAKAAFFWACAGWVALTLVVGFSWGGWVTGDAAAKMVNTAVADARMELAATICVARFMNDPDATAQFASLKTVGSHLRGKFIEEGGWSRFPGFERPVDGAAELCAQRLMDAKPRSAKAATAAG